MAGFLLRSLISSKSVNKYCHHRQFLFLIGQFLKVTPLKPLGQMNRNVVGSSSIKIAYLSQFVNEHGHHWQFLFLVVQFLKIFSSDTAWPNEQNLSWKHILKASMKITNFVGIRKQT
jgi:hypothetical protein